MKTRLALLLILFISFASPGLSQQCTVGGGSTSVQYVSSTITLKILLVEFSNVTHRTSPCAYKKTDFENLLVSCGTFVSPNMYNPDGESVYGSLRDYFSAMSNGNLTITGAVVNTVGGNDVPNWVVLGHSKSDYANYYYDFVGDALSAASAQGLSVSGLGDNVKLVIIYAGNIHFNDALNPFANGIGGTVYIASERNGYPASQENSGDVFGRIGVHGHEFAHVVGIGHSSGSRADIMEAGRRNGPNSGGSNGSAPAPLNPMHRALKGWVSPTVITCDQQINIAYSLKTPQVLRVNSNANSDYFLIENRAYNQNMTIGSTTVADYNNAAFMPIGGPHSTITQGVLVWRVIGGTPSDYSNNGLIYASGRWGSNYPENNQSETDDADPFPGNANTRVLSPTSDSRDPYSYSTDFGYYHNNIFVPNTKPGTNVGLGIISETPSQALFTVKVYAVNPPGAPPATPQNLAFPNAYTNNQHPYLTWSSNSEPYLSGYNVGRWYTPNREPSQFNMVASIIQATTFTDYEMMTSTGGGNSGYISYYIEAVDIFGRKSAASSEVGSATPDGGQASKGGNEFDKMITGSEKASGFELLQNYPNPFNPETKVAYALPEPANVVVTVSDLLGRSIATLASGKYSAGFHNVRWNGIDDSGNKVGSGIYFYRIIAIGESGKRFTKVIKMLMAK